MMSQECQNVYIGYPDIKMCRTKYWMIWMKDILDDIMSDILSEILDDMGNDIMDDI